MKSIDSTNAMMQTCTEDEAMETTLDGDTIAKSLMNEWNYQALKDQMKTDGGVSLPFFDKGKGGGFKKIKPVLKLHFKKEDGPLPDPWLLMVKAAVNFSFVIYEHTLFPRARLFWMSLFFNTRKLFGITNVVKDNGISLRRSLFLLRQAQITE